MCFAELALAGGLVIVQSGQLGALDVKERLVALRARCLEPGAGFGERCLDVSRRLEAPAFPESAALGEQRRELPQSGAASAADDDRFVRRRQRLCEIAEAEMRGGDKREHAAFHQEE